MTKRKAESTADDPPEVKKTLFKSPGAYFTSLEA